MSLAVPLGPDPRRIAWREVVLACMIAAASAAALAAFGPPPEDAQAHL